jgi:hypothetical protein
MSSTGWSWTFFRSYRFQSFYPNCPTSNTVSTWKCAERRSTSFWAWRRAETVVLLKKQLQNTLEADFDKVGTLFRELCSDAEAFSLHSGSSSLSTSLLSIFFNRRACPGVPRKSHAPSNPSALDICVFQSVYYLYLVLDLLHSSTSYLARSSRSFLVFGRRHMWKAYFWNKILDPGWMRWICVWYLEHYEGGEEGSWQIPVHIGAAFLGCCGWWWGKEVLANGDGDCVYEC